MNPRVVFRLSPNEEASLLHRKREDRRRARLLQVREQEKAFSQRVRGEVQERREEERRVLEEHLQGTLEASHETELRELEERYLSRAGQFGQGHKAAQVISEEENRLQELRMLLAAKQRWRAQDRHRAAMKELTSNHLSEQQDGQRHAQARRQAQEGERERARQMAAKPRPASSLIMDLAVGKGQRVRLKEVEGYASTHYHIPSSTVQRAAAPELAGPTGQEMAQSVMEQEYRLERNSAMSQQEQQEKARLRYKHALASVRLEREKEEFLGQLKVLERRDREHRQRALAGMPANVFRPAQQRAEMVCEQQRDMEEAFEKLFVKTHGVGLDTHCVLAGIANSASPKPSEDCSLLTDAETSSSATYTPPFQEQETRMERSLAPNQPRSAQLPPIPEESQESDQGSQCAEPQNVSPTPAMFVKVPTAGVSHRHHGRNQPSDLSISDVTPSDLASAYESSRITTTSSTKECRPPINDDRLPPDSRRELDEPVVPSVRPIGEVHSRLEAQRRHQMPTSTTAVSGTSGGIQRLVSMIRSQQQTWNERMATRARLLLSAVSPNSGSTSPDQPPSLSIHTLSSSGRSTALDEQTPDSTRVPVYERDSSPDHKLPLQPATTTSTVNGREPTVSTSFPPEMGRQLPAMKDWQAQQTHFSLPHNQFLPHMMTHTGTHSQFPTIPRRILTTTTDSATQQTSSGMSPFDAQHHYHSTLHSQSASLQPQQSPPSLVSVTRTTSDHPSYYSHVSGTGFENKYRETNELECTNQSSQHTPSGVHPLVQEEEGSSESIESSSHVSDREEMRAFDQHDPLSFTTLDSSLPLTTMASDDTSSSNRPVRTEPVHTLPAEIAQGQSSHSPVAISQVVHRSLPVHPPRRTSPGFLDSFRVGQQTGALGSDAINLSTTVEHGSVSSDNEHLYHLDTGFKSNSTESIMAYLPIPEAGTEPSHLPQVEAAQSMTPRSDVMGSMAQPRMEWSLSPYSDAGVGITHLERKEREDHNSSIESQQGSDVPERAENPPDHEPPSTSPIHSGTATQPTTSSSLSLQEMFLLKKQEFIQKSQSRVQQMEANAREQRIKAAQKPDGITHLTPRTGVRYHVAKSHTWEKSQAEYAQPSGEGNSETATSHQRRAVSFSSPLLRSQQSGVFTPPMIHKAQSQRKAPVLSSQGRSKISKKEMRERNLRFHSRLPEVREQRKAEKRLTESTAYREKARLFQEKVRAKLKHGKTLVNLTREKTGLRHERPFKS